MKQHALEKERRRHNLAQQHAVRVAVLAERKRCETLCEDYAKRAAADGLLVHPQIARMLGQMIARDPSTYPEPRPAA